MNDKTFRDTIAPFSLISEIEDGGDAKVIEMLNTYFSNVALIVGFEGEIVSVEDVLQKHIQHQSVHKIKMNTPELPVVNHRKYKDYVYGKC